MFLSETSKYRNLRDLYLGDNCIQFFHLGRYIVGYTVGNLVLRRRACGAVKRDFRTYIRRYTSPNEKFEYGYPQSNALLQFRLKLKRYKPYKTARQPTICDVVNDVKLFPTVYHRIYCRIFWRYPIRSRVTKASALEWYIMIGNSKKNQVWFKVIYKPIPFSLNNL